MDILKRAFIVLVVTGSTMLSAQQTTALQEAFYRSYEAETGGRYTQAINELVKIYKADDYFINIRMGWLYYQAKMYEKSELFYRKAIRLKPYSIEARFGLVKPLSATGNWDQVQAQYSEILKIAPQNTVASYWLGVIHYNRKEYAKAERLFGKVVNLYPLDYDSVIMLAWTKLNLRKPIEARTLFMHALTLRKSDESAIEGLKLIK